MLATIEVLSGNFVGFGKNNQALDSPLGVDFAWFLA